MKKKLASFVFIALLGIIIFPVKSFALDLTACVGSACPDLGTPDPDTTFFNRFSAGSNPYGLPDGSIFGIVTNILNWLLGLLGIFGVIGFILSGILYLTSAGNDGQIKQAKTAMNYSLLGVIVGLAGFVILQAVFSMLSATSNF